MAEQADLEDSNLANYGGTDHRDAAKKAAQSEKEFVGAGQKPGLEIWRVENRRTKNDTPDFGVKRWPQDQYGEFYDGDSYIVLKTYKVTDPETGKLTDELAWDVHFWLGKDTSIDERGVAAYKTVELDDLLDDGPVQHRETMSNESTLFKGYFKNMQYLSGGIESGFRKVKPEEYKPRLLQVRKSKKTIRATEVDCSYKSMNRGDCYVLDLGIHVIQYLGPDASPFERNGAAQMQFSIVNGRNGKSKGLTYEQGVKEKLFWETLGGSEAEIASAEEGNKKNAGNEELAKDTVKVYRISDSSGKVEFSFVEKGDNKGYTTSQLDSGDVFVVDSNIEIFIWRGKGASKREKSQAWKLVDKYMEDNDRPSTLPVTVIDEGKVNKVFGSCFAY